MDAVRYLLELAPEQKQDMISADNHAAFRSAALENHVELIHYLLEFFSVFEYAKLNLEQYNEILLSYIDLRARKNTLMEEEAQTLFNYTRHLIH